MKVEIHSTLERITDSVFQSKNVEEAREVLKGYLEESRIKEGDKRRMIEEVSSIKTLYKMQYYVCNSLLKYEGLSTKERGGI